MPENIVVEGINPIEYFRMKAGEATSRQSRDNLLRTVEMLSRYAGGAELSFCSFDREFMDEWLTRLLYEGYTPKTINNNLLKRLSTLYNKAVEAGLATDTDIFRHYQDKVGSELGERVAQTADRETFTKLQALIRSNTSANLQSKLGRDMLLFAIYQGGMSPVEIADYKKDDYCGDSESILAIVSTYSKSRNKYLFPLNQSGLTTRQRERFVQLLLSEAMKTAGLRAGITTYDLWAMAALGSGVSGADVSACLRSRGYQGGVAAFVAPSDIDTDEIRGIRDWVAAALSYNPKRWYALHLRPHVSYERLMSRLKERDIIPDSIYYPMEEIVSKVGRKKVFETRPVISWLVFIRERVSRLNSLLSDIGDLAWCYRSGRTATGPYAVVSDTEIAAYQRALGTLTPETPLLPDEAVELRQGDYLVLLGGAMNGRPGIFVTEKHCSGGPCGGRIIYRVRLSGGTHANWIVDSDPRLVRKITASQYHALDHHFNNL